HKKGAALRSNATQSRQCYLVFRAVFLFLLTLVMFAQHLAALVENIAPLLAVLFDHGFVATPFLLPANDLPTGSLLIRRLLHGGRNVGAVDFLLLVFFFLRLRRN